MISGDGRYIAYEDHFQILAWDRITELTAEVSNRDRDGYSPSISSDGRYIAFFASSFDISFNNVFNVEVWDRTTGLATQVTRTTRGTIRDPVLSGDGRFVAYSSSHDSGGPEAPFNVFLLDRTSGLTTQVTDGNLSSYLPMLSSDGGHVSFQSRASNLVPHADRGRSEVYVWEASSGRTTRVTHGIGDSSGPAISGNGDYVTYESSASDLVPGDNNGQVDVFVWSR